RYRNILIIADLEDNSGVTELVMQHLGEDLAAKALNNPDFFLGKKKNIWAQNQNVVFLFAPGTARLDTLLTQHAEYIRDMFLGYELKRYREAAMAGGSNKKIMEQIQTKFGFSMEIPFDYFVAIDN